MIGRFVRGEDPSVAFANEIEKYTSQHFRGTTDAEELMEALATYRPGGPPGPGGPAHGTAGFAAPIGFNRERSSTLLKHRSRTVA